MTPQQFERVREVFLAARELNPDQRSTFLDDACGDTPELRNEVEALLSHERHSSGPLDAPFQFGDLRNGIERALQTFTDQPLPDRIGRYTIISRLGGGGMGVVYLAEQEHPRRKVALKVVRPDGLSHSLLRRFEHEASILGQLAHPGIAHIHDAGVADVQVGNGVSARWPFFAMEYVQGVPLDEYVRRHKSSVRRRLTLLAEICDAVHHAHQKGVIHRDLKPSNILVDEQGRARILDFGIARLTNADVQAVTTQTELGQIIGTVPYMSPEQVTGVSTEVDTRSDVYALGVIGYEMLSGRMPYDVQGRSIPEAVRVVREEEPRRLSSIDTLFRGDLETIFLKALEKDKTRRYPSASELAADIRNYLGNRPIVARPPTTFYQLRMFARRNRALVGGVIATFLALIVGMAGIAAQARRVTHERNHARDAEQLAERRRDLAEFRAYVAHVAAAQAALRANDVATARQRLEAAPEPLRNWEWRYLANRLDGSLARWTGHDHYAWSVDHTPDGRWLATTSTDGTMKLWDGYSGRLLYTMAVGRGSVRKAAISPDGTRIVVTVPNGSLLIARCATGEKLTEIAAHHIGVLDATWSPDGTRIASSSHDGTARVWDADTGQQIAALVHPSWVHAVCFTPDGTRLATSCRDNVARLWDLSSGLPLLEIEVLPSTPQWDFVHSWAIAMAPDGSVLATGGHDGQIKLWSTETGSLLKALAGHTDRVRALAFSPDGSLLASGCDAGTVRIWDPAAGVERVTLLGHEQGVFGVDFSPDGMRLASVGTDRSVRLWDPRVSHPLQQIRGHNNRGIRALDVSRDGERILSAGEDGLVRLWDVESGVGMAFAERHKDWACAVTLSPDGTRAASGSRTGVVRTWNTAEGTELDSWKAHEGPVDAVLYLPDSDQVASAGEDGVISIRDGHLRSDVLRIHDGAQSFTALACRPGHRQLAVGTATGFIAVWSIESGRRLHDIVAHEGRIWCVAYSPDGAHLVSGANDGTLKSWSSDEGRLELTFDGHSGPVSAAAFSPDGTRLASVSLDRTLRLWDSATGETVLAFRAHQDWPYSVRFSPDGSWLASAGKSIRLWETEPLSAEVREARLARIWAEEFVDRMLLEADGDADLLRTRIRADREIEEARRCLALRILDCRTGPGDD